ncbi:epoxyqueuosine reductase [Formosimonas limnophila]|uniref:Epoxyqueuosine reductase n=1 Tax=Formosimonas limnophila TaxID=1384487 RepID=A0A8J3CLD8_9BURK|nr:tRNA epoxyqueuosine(34) reductase QueG [Formosimonas limnophila]GHA65101.1 epoxyqueuosine reductase [Formosimonas limnophila]
MTDITAQHCTANDNDRRQLAEWIKSAAQTQGFSHIAISQPDLRAAKTSYQAWLAKEFHGEMSYLTRNLDARFEPATLVPETISIISVTLPYLAADLAPDWQTQTWQTIENPSSANISRYALARDYHKVVRSRLQKLAEQIEQHIGTTLIYRAFSDSAPVPEVEIAQQTALGWRGKHTLLLNRESGSMFFLGELYVNLDLPMDVKTTEHCGSCHACLDICPTQAIIAPYKLDARRCISYLTIEYNGVIPHEFRPAIGNRIYGCDDCQLACPWNKFAVKSDLPDFEVRHQLDQLTLLDALSWSESTFKDKMAGSAIYRIGHAQWQRNVLLALGNGEATEQAIAAVAVYTAHADAVISEQAIWSLTQLNHRKSTNTIS